MCSLNSWYHRETVGYETPTTSCVCCKVNFFCQHQSNNQMVSKGNLLPLSQQLLLILNGTWHCVHRHRSSRLSVRIYRLPQCGQCTRLPKIACLSILLSVHLLGTCFSMCIQMDLVMLIVLCISIICQVHLLYITPYYTLAKYAICGGKERRLRRRSFPPSYFPVNSFKSLISCNA